MESALYKTPHFSHCFHNCLFAITFHLFNIICLGMSVFIFILFGVLSIFWICIYIFFPRILKFSVIISLNRFTVSLFLYVYLFISSNAYVVLFDSIVGPLVYIFCFAILFCFVLQIL
jgi:hypothetical protein